MGDEIGLEARDPAPRPHQRHHLAHDALRLRHIDQDQPHMRAVERPAFQPGIIGIALTHLDLRQRMIGDEPTCHVDEMRAALKAQHRAGHADALAKQMQYAAWSATQVDDPFTRLDADPLELCIGIRCQIGDLPFQPCFLGRATAEQIFVLPHGARSPSSRRTAMRNNAFERSKDSTKRQRWRGNFISRLCKQIRSGG